MFFVYSLRSLVVPEHYYIGITTDFDQRLAQHNSGSSPHTQKFRPWQLVAYVAFSDQIKAEAFEAYLKTGSGRAFCKRHF